MARLGRVTGSVAADVAAFRRDGKESEARRKLRLKLVTERLTGVPMDKMFETQELAKGRLLEPEARRVLEAERGYVIRETGFLLDRDRLVGCSLDGDVLESGGIVELKCPLPTTHLAYLLEGGVPEEYVPQVLHNMLVTGAEWCDFASYSERFPDHLRLLLVRVTRGTVAKELAAYEVGLQRFLKECDADYDRLVKLP